MTHDVINLAPADEIVHPEKSLEYVIRNVVKIGHFILIQSTEGNRLVQFHRETILSLWCAKICFFDNFLTVSYQATKRQSEACLNKQKIQIYFLCIIMRTNIVSKADVMAKELNFLQYFEITTKVGVMVFTFGSWKGHIFSWTLR